MQSCACGALGPAGLNNGARLAAAADFMHDLAPEAAARAHEDAASFREQFPATSRRSLEAFHRLTEGEQFAARNYGCSVGGVRHRRKGSCHDCRAIVATACRLLLGRRYDRRRLPRRPHSDTHRSRTQPHSHAHPHPHPSPHALRVAPLRARLDV